MNLLMNRLEKAIKEWEKSHGKKFINAKCADACGVKRQTFGDWRKGRTQKILGAPLIKVADFFSLNPQWLSDGSGEKYARKLFLSSNNQNLQHLDDMANPSQILDILDIIQQTVGISEFFNHYNEKEQLRQIKILITALNTDLNEEQAIKLFKSSL